MGIFSLAIFKLFTYYKNSKIGMIIKSNISHCGRQEKSFAYITGNP
jgi:hypothetical protein